MANSKAETPALIVLGIVSMATNVMIPVFVDALIEKLGLSRVDAGRIASFEFIGALAGSILVLAFSGRLSRRTFALYGIPVWIAGNALSAIFPIAQWLPLLRAASGVGMGITLALAMGAIASRPNPVRLFAGLMVGAPLFLVGAIPALQFTVGAWGIPGAYCFLGAMAVAGLLFATRLPAGLPGAEGDINPGAMRILGRSPVIAIFVLGVLVLFVGFSGAWAYVSQAGRSIGIAPQTVAWTIGIAQLASLAGSFLAGLLNERFGQALPLAVALGIAAAGAALLTQAGGQASYSASLVPLLFGWLMAQPFVMGIAARLDPSGIIATAATVAQAMGTAAGPYLAALAVEGQPASFIGYFAAVFFAAGLLLALPAALRASKLQRIPPREAI